MTVRKDVSDWVASCPVCQKTEPGNHHKFPLQGIVTGKPNELVQIDHLSLGMTKSDNCGVLMVVDHFNKYAEAYSVGDYTAKTTIERMTDNWIARWRVPTAIQADNGPAFAAELTKEFLAGMQTTEIHFTPYHPATNGAVERTNQTFSHLLKVLASQDPANWDKFVPMATCACNSTRHASTGFSPNMVMIGREASSPLTFFYPVEEDFPHSETGLYAKPLITKIADIHRLVRHNMKQAQVRQKRNFDKRAVNKPFKEGDLVQVKTTVLYPGEYRKPKARYRGPFSVDKVFQEGRHYLLNYGQKVHFKRLKPWVIRLTDFVVPPGKDHLQLKNQSDPNELVNVSEDATTPTIECQVASNAEDELLEETNKKWLRLEPDKISDGGVGTRLRPHNKPKKFYREP